MRRHFFNSAVIANSKMDYCEIKISQVTYPAKACGVKLCRRQDISRRIIICVHFEAWGVIKIISKLVTDGPF